jgi:mannose-6-phosphate isomerase
MELKLTAAMDKPEIFTEIQTYLAGLSLGVTDVDAERPWGGFFVIDEAQTADFIAQYFPDLPQDQIGLGGRLSPKILVVAPEKRLSWQLHHRRGELWKNIASPVAFITSDTDEQGPAQQLATDETIQFAAEVRHRLIGLDNWGVVAEIWQHTDSGDPSDENDIVRVSDDFGR